MNKELTLPGRMNLALKFFKGKILDIGCGNCKLVTMGTVQGMDITGCDISAEHIKEGKELAKEYEQKIKVEHASIYDLPFEKESFDTVFMGQIIEHLKKPKEGLDNALNVLKPGGKLIITTNEGFAHYDQDHVNFFFTKDNLTLFNKLWGFDMLPAMFHKICNFIDIDFFLKHFNCEVQIKEHEWKESRHPSLDLFIILTKKGKDTK